MVIDELNEGIIKKYQTKPHIFLRKTICWIASKDFWSYSQDNNLFGDTPPTINFDNISFKKPDHYSISFLTIFNLRFRDNWKLPIISLGVGKSRQTHPFQS